MLLAQFLLQHWVDFILVTKAKNSNLRLWLELKFLPKHTQRTQEVLLVLCLVLFELINSNQCCGKNYHASRLTIRLLHCFVSTVTTMWILYFQQKIFLCVKLSPVFLHVWLQTPDVRWQLAISFNLFQSICCLHLISINHSQS